MHVSRLGAERSTHTHILYTSRYSAFANWRTRLLDFRKSLLLPIFDFDTVKSNIFNELFIIVLQKSNFIIFYYIKKYYFDFANRNEAIIYREN